MTVTWETFVANAPREASLATLSQQIEALQWTLDRKPRLSKLRRLRKTPLKRQISAPKTPKP